MASPTQLPRARPPPTPPPPTRQVYKYWVAQYMSQRVGDTFEATVLGAFRPESGLYAVLLEGPGLETITKLPWSAEPGERLLLAVAGADPLTGFYRLSMVGELDSPIRAARLAAAETAEAARGGEGLGGEPWEMAGGGSGVDAEMEAMWAAAEAGGSGSDSDGDDDRGGPPGCGAAGGGSKDAGPGGEASAAATAAGLLIATANWAAAALSLQPAALDLLQS